MHVQSSLQTTGGFPHCRRQDNQSRFLPSIKQRGSTGKIDSHEQITRFFFNLVSFQSQAAFGQAIKPGPNGLLRPFLTENQPLLFALD
ncbi:hypothetical protein, partial [uncultured Allobaculum sp.]|uniref:hypothetical protein n=1 Tax=uncultured Allobaculum sp. TaxID=1187017 RepID=UPI00263AD38B